MPARTIKNCLLIKQGVAIGLGKPIIESDGKCVGYASRDDDDEPHDTCKDCRLNSAYESDS